MQSSSIQPSVAPNGPSTSTRNSKLDQIIQNFYTKTAQIIVQARCTPNNDSRYGKRNSLKGSLSNKKINKWFNLATEDIDVLREDSKYWRNMAVQSTDREPPPMMIDIYLDTSKLSHNQSLVVADDNLRWGGVELKSQTSDAHINRILIESWELTLNHPLPDFAVDLPSLYKRSIVFFRALHSTVRLLPAYDLYRKLHKVNDSNPLSIGYRLSSTIVEKNTEISLNSTILENDARNPTKTYKFSDIVTPIGTFGLKTTYRRNCDFKVEATERDLSAQFIDMDEQFFTPTMAKYQQEYARPRPVSMYSPISKETVTRQQSNTFSPSTSPRNSSDPQAIHPRLTHTTSMFTNNRHTSEHPSNTITSRRASVPYVVSPFKSPFLASSPQAESTFSSSTARNYTPPSSEKYRVGADSGSFGRKIEFSSSFDKYKSSPNSRNILDSSGMMRRSSRASDHSLFNFKSENDDDDLEDFVRFVGSNQELRIFQSKSTTQLVSSGYNLSSGSDTTNSSITGSMFPTTNTKKVALSHFQNLRDTHTSLSESLSSSIMIGNSSQHDPVSGTSPVSSTSSTGRSYQPIIPSPLHAEQISTSPVHIPRSYPQLRSLTNNSNALRISKLPSSSQTEQDVFNGSNDMSAYSTYPQDHHQDLHMLRNLANTATKSATVSSHSNHIIGRAVTIPQQREKSPNNRYEEENTENHLYSLQRSRNTDEGSSLMQDNSTTTDINSSGQGRNNSMMDDDDSLVFKMSELECEGPSNQQKQNILFNNRFNNNLPTEDYFLELTPTPLSPPLLNRLQATISMSTVTEEEEKHSLSASESSNKSESSPKITAKPNPATITTATTTKSSQPHFNAW